MEFNMEDLLYRFKDFYYQSPDWIKRLVGVPFSVLPPSVRYGKVFIEFRNLLKKSQWWDKDKLQEYQMRKLGKLLQHAFKNVPYYANVFNEYGLKPKDVQTL
jgi:phenylacetate-CoA ligase